MVGPPRAAPGRVGLRMTGTLFSLFQAACVVVVIVTLLVMVRARPAADVLVEYAALAVSGFIGEETCISFYGFYEYAPGWHLRVHHVPLLIPLIWPLVILSARDVVRSLLPALGVGSRALAVAVAVVLDATLMEVLSVRAGLWSWAEPGLLGVPVIGLLGWGFFAAGVSLALDGARSRGARAAATIVLGPLVTHALILACWWGLFRYAWRSDLDGFGLAAHAAFALAVTVVVGRARRSGRGIDRSVWLPRVAATSLFVAVFLVTARPISGQGLVLGMTSLPYLVGLRLRA